MKLKTVKLISIGMLAIDVVVLFAAVLTKQKLYSYISVVLILATGLFETGYYTCPECGKFLGKLNAKKCPNCGTKIQTKQK